MSHPTQTRMRRITAHAHHLRRPLVAQFIKFGLVGVSNTVLAFGIYTVLVKVVGVWYLAASAIGFAVGAVNGYMLNRSWTFQGHGGSHSRTAPRWILVQGCGLLLNLGLVYLFVAGLGLDELVGQAFATVIVVVLTFLGNRYWTFHVHRPLADRA